MRQRRGFTLIELLVSIAIIVVLIGLITALIGRSRAAAQGVACIARLHSIGLSLIQYAHDNGDRFPDPVALNQSWEQCIQQYIANAEAFHCPGDQEVFPTVGSSYDWRDTGGADTTLAGLTLHDANRSYVVLAFESLPGWHAKGRMNAAMLDGSAQVMDQNQCLLDIQTPIR